MPAEAGAPHDPALFMEDTVWPFEDLVERYVERLGAHYLAEMRESAERGEALLTVLGGFRTAFGSGRRREIVLWQKITRPRALRHLLGAEIPARYRAPGTTRSSCGTAGRAACYAPRPGRPGTELHARRSARVQPIPSGGPSQ